MLSVVLRPKNTSHFLIVVELEVHVDEVSNIATLEQKLIETKENSSSLIKS